LIRLVSIVYLTVWC